MSAITDRRPIDLDQIEARRKAAYIDRDPAATDELVANDVPDMLAHLWAAQTQPAASPGYEVTQTPSWGVAQTLAEQGWRLVSAVGCGDNVLHYLDRHAPGTPLSVTDLPWLRTALEAVTELRQADHAKLADVGELVDQAREVVAERDRLVQALADEEEQSAHYRDQADEMARELRQEKIRVQSLEEVRDQLQALRAEERAARERLAEQMQRVRDLHRPATTEVGLPTSAAPRCVVCKVPAPCDTLVELAPDAPLPAPPVGAYVSRARIAGDES